MRFLFKILPEKIFNLYILLSNYTSLSFAGKVRDILDKIVKAYCGIELNKKWTCGKWTCVLWPPRPNKKSPYVGVLIGCDGDELRLREGESLDTSWLAGVLCPIFVHFHHMEPRLVLVERLKNHHLEGRAETRVRNSAAKFGTLEQCECYTPLIPSELLKRLLSFQNTPFWAQTSD